MTVLLNFSRSLRQRARIGVWHVEALYWAVLGALLAGFVWHEGTLGLTYPMPWPDEALFLWQALAVRDNATLLAPELNEQRPIFLMPYGYMVLQGLVFKLTGFSLSWARTLSALYLAGTLVCVAAIARRFATRWAVLLLVLAFLSVPCVRFAGNTARMETLVTLAGAGGFVLLARGRWLAGMSMLALAPIVHPNGHFLVFGGIVYVAGTLAMLRVYRRIEGRPPPASLRTWEWLVAGGAVLTWSWFLAYFAGHSADFFIDLARQLTWKSSEIEGSGTASDRMQSAWYWAPLLLVSSASLLATRFAPAVLPLAALSFCLQVRAIMTVGWNYECYTALAYLCSMILLVEVAVCALAEGFPRARALSAVSALAAGVALALLLFRAGKVAPTLLHTVRQSAVQAPGHDRSAYFSPRDYYAVTDYLSQEQAAAKRPLRVSFFPAADALLFADVRSPSLRISHYWPGAPNPDVLIVHHSVWHTDRDRAMTIIAVGVKQGVQLPIEKWQGISRAKGSRWLVYSRALTGG